MKIVLKKSEAASPFSFAFKDENDKTIIKSESYKARKSALNGIESVKKNCLIDKRYEFKESKNGKYFFNIKASNGQIVGTSGFFATVKERDEAIEKLKKEAPSVSVEEI